MRNLPRAHLNGDDNKDKNFGLSRSRIRILYMYSAQTRQGHDVPFRIECVRGRVVVGSIENTRLSQG